MSQHLIQFMREKFYSDSRVETIQNRINELHNMATVTYRHQTDTNCFQPIVDERVRFEIKKLQEMLEHIYETEYAVQNVPQRPLPSLIELVKRPVMNPNSDYEWVSKMTEEEIAIWKDEQHDDFEYRYETGYPRTNVTLMSRMIERDKDYLRAEKEYKEKLLREESQDLINRVRNGDKPTKNS